MFSFSSLIVFPDSITPHTLQAHMSPLLADASVLSSMSSNDIQTLKLHLWLFLGALLTMSSSTQHITCILLYFVIDFFQYSVLRAALKCSYPNISEYIRLGTFPNSWAGDQEYGNSSKSIQFPNGFDRKLSVLPFNSFVCLLLIPLVH